jgi:hypothetical protein
MPSPFPGMDPFLEDPALWPDVHHAFLSEMQYQLNAQLRPKYYARVELRVYVSDETDPGRSVMVPDVRLGQAQRNNATLPAQPQLTTPEPVEVVTLLEEEIEEAYLQVHETASHQLVTIIELLSPANKAAGSHGRESFIAKRKQVLRSPVSWVEIDLLRGGQAIATWDNLPACDYSVHVSKPRVRPKGNVWPLQLANPLPPIPIPLREPDPDAPLNLQRVLANAYERGAYDLSIDYQGEPIPPLDEDEAQWMDQLLKEKGLR